MLINLATCSHVKLATDHLKLAPPLEFSPRRYFPRCEIQHHEI